jgi:hypothetical protein
MVQGLRVTGNKCRDRAGCRFGAVVSGLNQPV